MTKIIIDLSISVDGFIAGPGDDVRHPLGKHGGESVFDWYNAGGEPMGPTGMWSPIGINRRVVEAMLRDYGAMIFGRRTYDISHGWHGTHPVNGIPIVILTHKAPEPPRGKSRFMFVRDAVSAVRAAREAAGRLDVGIGGASVAQQALAAGIVDELYLHVAPIVLGAGVRLFDKLGGATPIKLDQTEVIHGPGVTHVRYRVLR